MLYEIGDYIVKPGHGVCRVENTMHLDISGADRSRLYYLLIPITDKNEKIYVPADAAGTKTRKAMTEKEAWEFIGRIAQIDDFWIENEKLRDQKYKEAVQSGVPEKLAAIIKETYLRKKRRSEQGKKSTVADEHYFRLAENYLYSELGFALNKDKDEVRKMIIEHVRRNES